MRYKTYSIIILYLLLLVCTFSWSEGIWESPWFPVTPNSVWLFNDVYFVEPQQGWTVGYSLLTDTGFVAHTSGDGWKAQFYASHFIPEVVQFLTPQKGWVAGYRRIEDEKTEGVLLYTEDGGKHWRERRRFPRELHSLQFVTENNGWIVGYTVDADGIINSVVLATADGGENWTLQYEGRNELLDRGLCFTDANNGWIPGTAIEQDGWKSLLLHTTDGGENWTRLPVDHLLVGGGWIAAVDFIGEKKGWTVVLKGIQDEPAADDCELSLHWTIYHTDDGGQTWIKQKTDIEKHSCIPSSIIRSVNENEVWVTVGGTILHTEDGGSRWTPQEYKFTIDDKEREIWPRGMYFLDEKRGWIVERGILHTTDGGVTWSVEPQSPFGDLNLNEVVFVTSKKGWVVGENGAIFHTMDAGKTWETQESSTPVELLGAHFVTVQEGWVVGDEGTILHTTDEGDTWVKQESGTQITLNDVQFMDAQEGWVVGGQIDTGKGIILHTTDGGEHWKTVENAPVEHRLKDVHFVNRQTGWVAGLVFILHTEDGGKSWKKQGSPFGSVYNSIYFVDDLTGWVAGRSNIVGEDGKVRSVATIAHSVDGGYTWKLQHQGVSQKVYFANRREGWGLAGYAPFHTTDGGQTWTRQWPLGYLGPLRSVCYGGKGTLWAVGGSGTLLKYSDPNLRVIQPSYWVVKQSGKDILPWADLRKQGQRPLSSVSPLTNQLFQNYPNPFNPETWLPYQLAQDSEVTIKIYDVKGQLVRTLFLGKKKAGWYTNKKQAARWDGRNSTGSAVSNGVYFYTLTADEYTATRKLVLLK